MAHQATSVCRVPDLEDISNSDQLGRICLHSNSKDLQSMVIYMPPCYTYDFIADNVDGFICFVVLSGSLTVTILEAGIENTFHLLKNESLFTSRSNFRRTCTGQDACIYMENLSAGFHPDQRLTLNTSI